MTGTGIAEIVMIMMIVRSGVSMTASHAVLHNAIQNGNEIAERLAHGIEEKFISLPYIILPHYAVWRHWMRMDAPLTFSTTIINMALFYSRENVANIMIDRGANLFFTDQYGNTPLHIAAVRGLNIAVIKILDKIQMLKPQVIDIRSRFGDTPLHMAIRYNRNLVVKSLLDRGADPMIADKYGNTALHLAVPTNLSKEIILDIIDAARQKTVDILNQNGMTKPSVHNDLSPCAHRETSDIINIRNDLGKTALLQSLIGNSFHVVKILLDKGADPSITDNDGNTPFHINMPSALTDELILSCIQHMNVNHRNNNGSTLLHTAIKCKREVLVKDLLDRGANPIIVNHHGLTALHLAIDHGLSQQIIIHIIHAGRPKLSHLLIQSGMTERLYASIIHRLIDRGLNKDLVIEVLNLSCDGIINLRTQDGRTALFYAAARSAEIAQILLENGADPTITDKDHLGPFHDASMTDEIFNSMIQNVDVNHRYIDGSTILHLAIRLRRDVVVKYLLDKGASPTIADNSGNTALHRAIFSDVKKQMIIHILDAARPKAVYNLCQSGITQISGCLNGEVNHDDRQIDACEILNLRNHKGETALFLAFCFSRDNIAQVLIERGADPHSADNDGNTPLHFNMPGFLTDEFIISTLKNLDINYRHLEGNTYLHQAAKRNRENVIKYLLDRGANPKARNYFKYTVLHLAVEHNLSEQIVIDIIEAKALRQVWHNNMKRRFGSSGGLLSLCGLKLQDIFCGTWDQQLLNIRNFCGQTALHLAVLQQRVDLVRVLLKKGASRTIKACGETALDLARREKRANSTPFAATIVELLESKNLINQWP